MKQMNEWEILEKPSTNRVLFHKSHVFRNSPDQNVAWNTFASQQVTPVNFKCHTSGIYETLRESFDTLCWIESLNQTSKDNVDDLFSRYCTCKLTYLVDESYSGSIKIQIKHAFRNARSCMSNSKMTKEKPNVHKLQSDKIPKWDRNPDQTWSKWPLKSIL